MIGLSGPPGVGLTRVGLHLLASPATEGMVAVLDVRGWFCPSAAWEMGIDPDRLVIVRCQDPAVWTKVAAALIEGMRATLSEVPSGVPDAALRRLGALARARRSSLILRPLRGGLPSGLTHLRLSADAVEWVGRGRCGARPTRPASRASSGKRTGGPWHRSDHRGGR